ncbi:hypothetical protein [Novosphingopyxis sp.]
MRALLAQPTFLLGLGLLGLGLLGLGLLDPGFRIKSGMTMGG